YTNADSVELFLNDRSLGTRAWVGVAETHLAWQVPYEPGRLRAVARRAGKVVAEEAVETTGPAVRIDLTPDRSTIRADGQDLAFVTVRLLDSRGRLVRAVANQLLKFTVTGAGSLVGLDNGDPTNHEPFKGTEHRAFNGLALAIVRSTRTPGTVTVSV